MKVDMYVLCTPQQDEEASASPSFNKMWPKTIWMYLQSLFLQDFTKNYALCLFHPVLKIASCWILRERISHPVTYASNLFSQIFYFIKLPLTIRPWAIPKVKSSWETLRFCPLSVSTWIWLICCYNWILDINKIITTPFQFEIFKRRKNYDLVCKC